MYGVVLGISVWFDRKESLEGKLVLNFWVVATIVFFNTAATFV